MIYGQMYMCVCVYIHACVDVRVTQAPMFLFSTNNIKRA